ncbi:MAG TPA: acetoacetate decarboxylase family protein [Patescibacteria group bacterium]|nr:acetoacetate decarboxylase family protein [Patescibacteria group bacterium]
MARSDLRLAKMYRMPTVFGPAPGPRNVPECQESHRFAGDTVHLDVSALTDSEALAALLPPGCELRGEPLVRIHIMIMTNLGWLAGRGYNVVTVRIPAVFRGKVDSVEGEFIPVLWENLADPIITGREELGMPKIYAEIPPPIVLGDAYQCSASWMGFRFFELEVKRLREAPPPAEPTDTFVYKYFPKTGDWGQPDVEYMTSLAPESSQTKLLRRMEGEGRFEFHPARWEDMPTQYPIVNALAALPLAGFRSSSVTWTTGKSDLSAQRIVR